LWEGFADEFFAESDAAVFWVDDDSGDCGDFGLELLGGSFPGFVSAEAEWWWVAVDDCADEFLSAF